MSSYLQWIVLSALTGSPVGSAIFLLVFYFVADRFTLGLLPDPLRWVTKFQREMKLRRLVLTNPHDGQSRRELAQLYVERRAWVRAIEVLKPYLEKGDDDVHTVFLMGAACMGAGYYAQAEKLLAHALELDHDFRVGEIDLTLGRGRLKKGDYAGAKQALESLLKLRRGSIEGRVLLARALTGLGDDGAAALVKDQAWEEYRSAPRFQQRNERLWAWRAKPSRPALYAVLVVLALAACTKVVKPMAEQLATQSSSADDDDE